MSESEVNFSGGYFSFEIATVQEPDGRWRVFITEMLEQDWPTSIPINPFELPTFPTRPQAEDLGALMVWKLLDATKVRDPATGLMREIDVLE